MTGKEKLEMEKMLADEVKKLGVEGLGAPEITHRTKGPHSDDQGDYGPERYLCLH